MSVTLCYWDLRGLGEASRLLLHYAEAEWEDKRLVLSETAFGDWKAEKFNLGLDFPNLPYLIDGDIKITQSVAIIRYLGRKFNLTATSEAEHVRLDLAEQELQDMKMAQSRLCYNPKYEELKAEYVTNLAVKVSQMDKFLGAGPWVLGEKMTYVDFMAYEFMDASRKQFPDNFKEAANINAFLDRLQALPRMKEWFNSDAYKAGQYINSPMAAWHGKE